MMKNPFPNDCKLVVSLLLVVVSFLPQYDAFMLPSTASPSQQRRRWTFLMVKSSPSDLESVDFAANEGTTSSRRNVLEKAAIVPLAAVAAWLGQPTEVLANRDQDLNDRQFVQESYSDFVKNREGWLFRDVSVGKGESAKSGDRVVFDWSGYTIGYFGRPFQAKGGPQGGAFDKQLDYERTVIGSGKMVKGLEQAFVDMKPGGVRRVVIPYGPLSYPAEDKSHDRVGPKPATFSGDRALNFVLDNPNLDRTLLFNIKVIRVDKPDGKGGFVRGA